jgi:hypothetical protein
MATSTMFSLAANPLSRSPPAGASRRGRASRVVTRGTVRASTADDASTPAGSERLDAIRARATAGALPGSGPFALLDPDAGYTHVSPGVCDACADDVEARKAWVRVRDRSARAPPRGSGTRALASRPPGRTRAPPALPQNRVGGRFPLRTAPPPHLLTPSILPNPPFRFRAPSLQVALLLGQFPSHVANAERTRDFLSCWPDAAESSQPLDSYMERYELWAADYEAYLERCCSDEYAPHQGPTLLDMVDEKERLLRRRALPDLFAGMKADENAIAAALFPALALELDDIWEPEPGAMRRPEGETETEAERKARMFASAIECCLAGNLFDAGAASAVQNVAFRDEDSGGSPRSTDPDTCVIRTLDAEALRETFQRARERVRRDPAAGGYRYDGLDALIARATGDDPWRRVVIFCDNAGADVMGMTLLARSLAGLGGAGTKIALVANDTAALNDITHEELKAFLAAVTDRGDPKLSRGGGRKPSPYDASGIIFGDALLGAQMNGCMVTALPSGQCSTLLDLNRAGAELNDWVREQFEQVPAGREWLVVFDGMGRGLESNWDVGAFVAEGVQTLNLAMIKSEINAKRLDAEVYDCVVKLETGGGEGRGG